LKEKEKGLLEDNSEGETNELTAEAYSTSILAIVELYMVAEGRCLIVSSVQQKKVKHHDKVLPLKI
jgi:hypothetical protein